MVTQTALEANWRLLDLSYPSVFQNLALEEALAYGTSSCIFRPTIRLWIDPPAVVVGRFQNVKTEVDTELCQENDVDIARRFTGGGAVFHDKGNLNFTVVMRRLEGIPLSKFHEINAAVILDSLHHLGLESTLVPPNSVVISGKKVSGAAAALSRDFALWHASILISTDTILLNRILSPSRHENATTHVRSRWQSVTTLQAALGRSVDIDEVKLQLLRSAQRLLGVSFEADGLRNDEELSMKSLYARKYLSNEWNFYGTRKENAI